MASEITKLEAELSRLKKEELALKATIDRFQKLVDDAPAVICKVDAKGTITFINQVIKPISGYSPEELIGKSIMDTFFPGALSKQIGKIVEEIKKQRDIVQYTATIRAKDGSSRNILWTSCAVWDKKGNLVEVNGIGQLSPGKKPLMLNLPDAGQKASENFAGFEKMTAVETIWLSAADTQGNVLLWNKGAEKISGYKREEVLGNNKIYHWLYPDPEYYKEVIDKTIDIVSRDIRETLETTITTKTGEKRTISWNSVGLVDSAGKPVGQIAVGIDITERKKLEEQERLAEKMDALSRLAAGVAHDFNNMLSIIQGYLELTLEAMDYGDPLRENLLEIVEAMDRGAKLTNQLLAFSKRQLIEPISYDINRSIKDMSRVFKRAVGDDVNLVLNLGENVPPVKADPVHIEQCLLNLVMNAREAMSGFGTLAISTSVAKIGASYITTQGVIAPGDYVLISVADTGKGMNMEVKNRIFEPFFSTREGAAGLGLASVYGIISQHNGYIWGDSEPKQGTTFNIYMPISKEPAEQPRQKETKMEMPLGTESILLVEDDIHLLALSARILRRLGYTVFEAANPSEALLILEKYPAPLQLLLTDIMMPKMNGIELSKRALSFKPDLKVLYVTGHPLTDLTDEAPPEHAANLLIKPFKARALAQKVREILDHK